MLWDTATYRDMFTYIPLLSPVTFLPGLPVTPMCVAWCMLYGLAASSYISYPSMALPEMQEFTQSTRERVDMWTCSTDCHVCSEQSETQRGNSTSLQPGRNSSFFSSLPALSLLLPVHSLRRTGLPIIEMSEAAGEDSGFCCMNKTRQLSEFVFKQQDLAKSEHRFSVSLRWTGKPPTFL